MPPNNFTLTCPITNLPCTRGCGRDRIGIENPDRLRTCPDLIAEYRKWDQNVKGANAWGAALGAAASFRRSVANELQRRGMALPQ